MSVRSCCHITDRSSPLFAKSKQLLMDRPAAGCWDREVLRIFYATLKKCVQTARKEPAGPKHFFSHGIFFSIGPGSWDIFWICCWERLP